MNIQPTRFRREDATAILGDGIFKTIAEATSDLSLLEIQKDLDEEDVEGWRRLFRRLAGRADRDVLGARRVRVVDEFREGLGEIEEVDLEQWRNRLRQDWYDVIEERKNQILEERRRRGGRQVRPEGAREEEEKKEEESIQEPEVEILMEEEKDRVDYEINQATAVFELENGLLQRLSQRDVNAEQEDVVRYAREREEMTERNLRGRNKIYLADNLGEVTEQVIREGQSGRTRRENEDNTRIMGRMFYRESVLPREIPPMMREIDGYTMFYFYTSLARGNDRERNEVGDASIGIEPFKMNALRENWSNMREWLRQELFLEERQRGEVVDEVMGMRFLMMLDAGVLMYFMRFLFVFITRYYNWSEDMAKEIIRMLMRGDTDIQNPRGSDYTELIRNGEQIALVRMTAWYYLVDFLWGLRQFWEIPARYVFYILMNRNWYNISRRQIRNFEIDGLQFEIASFYPFYFGSFENYRRGNREGEVLFSREILNGMVTWSRIFIQTSPMRLDETGGISPNERINVHITMRRRNRANSVERYFTETLRMTGDELTGFANNEQEVMVRWMLGAIAQIQHNMIEKSDQYGEEMVIREAEENTIDFDFVDISRIAFFIRENRVTNIPQINIRNYTPVYARNPLSQVFKTLLYCNEVTDLGICCYEVLWTMQYFDRQKNRFEPGIFPGNINKREDRKKAIINSFMSESDEVKQICLTSDLNLWLILARRRGFDVKYIIDEEEEKLMRKGKWMMSRAETMRNSQYLVVTKKAHILYVKSDKTAEYYIARNELIRERKENKTKPLKLVPPIKNRKLKKKDDEDEKEKEEKLIRNFYLDTETYTDDQGKQIIYLICMVDDDGEEFIWSGINCKDKFSQWLLSVIDYDNLSGKSHRGIEKIYVWTFNGSRFDIVLLMEKILQFEGVELKGNIGNIKTLRVGNVSFLDFLKISPAGSLKKQAEAYKIEHLKTDFDYKKVNKNNASSRLILDEAIPYCINDCIVLKELVQTYMKIVKEEFKISPYVNSTSQLALNLFKENFNKTKLEGVDVKMYEIIKSSYYGGVCQVFRRNMTTEEKIYGYDINSSYPFIMSTHEIPCKLAENKILNYTKKILFGEETLLKSTDLYFVDKLDYIDEWLYPMFGERDSTGLVYKMKIQPRWIWGVELNLLIKNKAVKFISITNKLRFDSSFIFKNYISEMYKHKKELSEKKEIESSSNYDVQIYFYKLMLNSLYGKFGQKIYDKKDFVSAMKLPYYCQVHNDDEYGISDIRQVGNEIYEISYPMIEEEYNKQIGSLTFISSYITAAARVTLFDAIFTLTNGVENNVFYCDTDSIYTSKELPQSMVDSYKLGKWKLEATYKQVYFAAPKVYRTVTDTEKITYKFKGIPKALLNDQIYTELKEKGSVKIDLGNQLLRKGSDIISINIDKNCCITYKRLFDEKGYSIPL